MLLTLHRDEYLTAQRTLADTKGDGQQLHDLDEFASILGEILHLGLHAVDAPPLVLDLLSQRQGLSDAQRSALGRMREAVTLRALPFDEVTHRLLLTGPLHRSPEEAVAAPPTPVKEFRRSWEWLCAQRTLAPTTLGGENHADANWFAWLARALGRAAAPKRTARRS